MSRSRAPFQRRSCPFACTTTCARTAHHASGWWWGGGEHQKWPSWFNRLLPTHLSRGCCASFTLASVGGLVVLCWFRESGKIIVQSPESPLNLCSSILPASAALLANGFYYNVPITFGDQQMPLRDAFASSHVVGGGSQQGDLWVGPLMASHVDLQSFERLWMEMRNIDWSFLFTSLNEHWSQDARFGTVSHSPMLSLRTHTPVYCRRIGPTIHWACQTMRRKRRSGRHTASWCCSTTPTSARCRRTSARPSLSRSRRPTSC